MTSLTNGFLTKSSPASPKAVTSPNGFIKWASAFLCLDKWPCQMSLVHVPVFSPHLYLQMNREHKKNTPDKKGHILLEVTHILMVCAHGHPGPYTSLVHFCTFLYSSSGNPDHFRPNGPTRGVSYRVSSWPRFPCCLLFLFLRRRFCAHFFPFFFFWWSQQNLFSPWTSASHSTSSSWTRRPSCPPCRPPPTRSLRGPSSG